MVAFATSAPLASRTVPTIDPVSICPLANMDRRLIVATIRAKKAHVDNDVPKKDFFGNDLMLHHLSSKVLQ
jgi:hypothetical protein